MEEKDKCPICNSPLVKDSDYDSNKFIWTYNCYRCGYFNLSETGINFINTVLKSTKYFEKYFYVLISGWIREHQDITIDNKIFESLMTLKIPSVAERANKLLTTFSKSNPQPGWKFIIDFGHLDTLLNQIDTNNINKEFLERSKKYLKYLAITWSNNFQELQYIYEDYLKKEMKYLTDEEPCKITPKGWAYLESLRQTNPDSKKAFVAMWFTDEMKEICEKHIKKAAEDAGDYKAEPINDKDYNGDINDAIIGEIRSSKFIIADFTGNRGGVYYEAGFAHGLNIPVIYTCREDWFNKFVKQSLKIKDSKGKEDDKELNIFSQIHFDINHHNFIIWKDGDDLYKQLLKRIKATIT